MRLSSRDPWSGAGDNTRAEVREIFARHAAARQGAGAGTPPVERRAALPGVLRLPARGWRALPLLGRLAVAALGVVLALLVALLLPPALQNATENQGRELVSGYRFRGRVELPSGRAAWCKENPRPLHPDQEEFVVVPLSRACTG